MNIPLFSIKHRAIIWMVLLIFVIAGVLSYFSISKREDPEIKISIALVVTIWPGASAEQVENLVTRKLEDKFEEISEVEELSSFTREQISIIMVNVNFTSDTAMAWQRLRNKIEEVRPDLPESVMGPDVHDDFGDVTAMIVSLSSSVHSPRELEDLSDDLRAELRKVESVGKIVTIGTRDEAIYIEGPLDSFSAYNFSPLVAGKILDYQNLNMPAGYVRTDRRNYRLNPTGTFKATEQIENTVIDVSKTTGHKLRVKDVFTVRRGYREPPMDLMFVNGVPGIALDLRMKKGYNVVAMGAEVQKVLDAFRSTLPQGVELRTVHDQPREVDNFINEFMMNLLEGILIVIIMMAIFMGLRTAAIIAVALPLSILVALFFMPILKVDMETVSIGAFIISLGMLVDNAIIVTDNIYAYLEKGESRLKAACNGAQQMAVPALTGTLAAVFAFLPLLLLKEETGAYIRSMPIVVSLALLASLVLAVTVTPLMAYDFLRKKPKPANAATPRWQVAYRRFMRFGIRKRYLVMLVAVLTLVGSLLLVNVLGFSFFPTAHRDQLYVDIWLPEGTALEETRKVARQVERMIEDDTEIVSYVTYVGKGGPRFMMPIKPEFNTTNYAQLMINTINAEATPRVVDRYNKRVRQEIAGARVTFKRIFLGPPVVAPIALRISGPDLGVMKKLSLQIQEVLRNTPGSINVRDNMGEQVQSLKLNIDSDAAIGVGVTNTEVALSLLTAYEGLPVTSFREDNKSIPVYIRLNQEQRDISNALHVLRVPSQSTGSKVPLSAFATVEPQWSSGIIHRHNNNRTITVLSDTHDRLADDVMREAWPGIEKIQIPEGYNLEVSGEKKEREKAFGQLLVVFGLIIFLLLFMLVVQFNSVKRALVILFSVPLAIIGAVLGLLVSGNSFSFMAFLGVVALAGMVIKNAIVWVEFVEHALVEGMDFEAAVIDAGIKRLRAITLAAGTTVGGLFPLALFGGPLWEGMSWAMIFGLSVSTILTLVVIPIIYYAVFRRQYLSGPPAGPDTSECDDAATGGGGPAGTFASLLLALGVAAALLFTPATAKADEHPVQAYVSLAKKKAIPAREADLAAQKATSLKQQAAASFAPIPMASVTATRLDKEMSFALDTSSLGLPLQLPEMVFANQNVYNASVKVTLPLFVGGMRWSMLSAAAHGEHAARLGRMAALSGVEFGTVARYVQYLEALQLEQVRAETLKVDSVVIDIATLRKTYEMGTAFDVSYAKTIAADSERKLAEAQSATILATHQLNDLVGRPFGDKVQARALQYDEDFDPSIARLLKRVRNRHELNAYREGAAAADEQAAAARGALLPTLALVGEGGYKHGDLGYTEGDSYWMVTVAFQWNLGLDASTWFKVKTAKIESREARLAAEKRRREIELQLTGAFEQFSNMRKIHGVARRGLATAQEGFDNAREAYLADVIPLTTFVDAARALVDAKLGYIQAGNGRLLTELQLKYLAQLPLLDDANLGEDDPFEALQLPPVELSIPPAPQKTPAKEVQP